MGDVKPYEASEVYTFTGHDEGVSRERIAATVAERDELRAWQLAVADGIGFCNRAEGQGGYEVAKPSVIVAYVRGTERDANIDTVNELRAERDEWRERSGQDCDGLNCPQLAAAQAELMHREHEMDKEHDLAIKTEAALATEQAAHAATKLELKSERSEVEQLKEIQTNIFVSHDGWRTRATAAEAREATLREALTGLVEAVSAQLARGEDTTPGDFERAWQAACAALAATAPEGGET